MKGIYSLIIAIIFLIGCNSQSETSYILTESEKQLCKNLEIDSTIIKHIRAINKFEIDSFHYSISKMYKDGKKYELNPIFAKGLLIIEPQENAYNTINSLRNDLKKKNYSIFMLEKNYGFDNEKDVIGILNTIDKFEVLKTLETSAPNYGIDNDSLITIIKKLDERFELELIGASGDFCEFNIGKSPENWNQLAQEIFDICPDVVTQGTGTIEKLSKEMKRSNSIYLWWD